MIIFIFGLVLAGNFLNQKLKLHIKDEDKNELTLIKIDKDDVLMMDSSKIKDSDIALIEIANFENDEEGKNDEKNENSHGSEINDVIGLDKNGLYCSENDNKGGSFKIDDPGKKCEDGVLTGSINLNTVFPPDILKKKSDNNQNTGKMDLKKKGFFEPGRVPLQLIQNDFLSENNFNVLERRSKLIEDKSKDSMKYYSIKINDKFLCVEDDSSNIKLCKRGNKNNAKWIITVYGKTVSIKQGTRNLGAKKKGNVTGHKLKLRNQSEDGEKYLYNFYFEKTDSF